MALIDWKDSLSINVAQFDTQHKKLVAIINDLSDAMKQRKSNEVLGKILASLVDYTKTHFGDEEKFLTQHAYPDTPDQKNEHIAFVKKIADYQTQFNSKKIGISVEILDFLSKWLVSHIQGKDKKYGVFANARGIK